MLNQAYQSNQTESAVRPSPEMEQIVGGLAELIERFGKSTSRVEIALDRFHGGRPRSIADSKGVPDSPPSNTLGSMRQQLQTLNSIEAHLADLAQRLDSIV